MPDHQARALAQIGGGTGNMFLREFDLCLWSHACFSLTKNRGVGIRSDLQDRIRTLTVIFGAEPLASVSPVLEMVKYPNLEMMGLMKPKYTQGAVAEAISYKQLMKHASPFPVSCIEVQMPKDGVFHLGF
jgi:hypothetical protein